VDGCLLLINWNMQLFPRTGGLKIEYRPTKKSSAMFRLTSRPINNMEHVKTGSFWIKKRLELRSSRWGENRRRIERIVGSRPNRRRGIASKGVLGMVSSILGWIV